MTQHNFKKIPSLRPTWAEIDLSALKYNFNKARELAGKDTKILVAVKADAYGHGMPEVSRALVDFGVDYLGVATSDEAITLRRSGIKTSVLIFGAILKEEALPAISRDISLTVVSEEMARFLSLCAGRLNKRVNVHAKIDTGMGRLGVWHEEAVPFIKNIKRLKNVELEGIYTHLASADEEDKYFTSSQLLCFNKLIEKLENNNISILLKHAANSMGVLRFKGSHLNLVRPGLMIYGLYSNTKTPRPVELKPALSFKTRIVYLKEIPKGRPISYGRTYVTSRKTKVATLPVGYGDGYPRFLSNRAHVLVMGKRAPVIGRVCMDQTMVDVSNIDGVKIRDEVVLIGAQQGQVITTEELADIGDTISYEIVCGISKRVPRQYKNVIDFKK
jgi:alanine racemase